MQVDPRTVLDPLGPQIRLDGAWEGHVECHHLPRALLQHFDPSWCERAGVSWRPRLALPERLEPLILLCWLQPAADDQQRLLSAQLEVVGLGARRRIRKERWVGDFYEDLALRHGKRERDFGPSHAAQSSEYNEGAQQRKSVPGARPHDSPCQNHAKS